MLAQIVRDYATIGANGKWTDPNAKLPASIATACHFATTYWLYLDEFSRFPTLDQLMTMGNAQLVVSDMIRHGANRVRPSRGDLMLTAGSLIIFAHKNVAEHSCVAIDPQTLAGYNQMGWYSDGGKDHQYSEHPTSQLMWSDATQVHRVAAKGDYQLFEVPQNAAKAVLRNAAQK